LHRPHQVSAERLATGGQFLLVDGILLLRIARSRPDRRAVGSYLPVINLDIM
jgi:hypothetical protein